MVPPAVAGRFPGGRHLRVSELQYCLPCFQPHELCLTSLKQWSCQRDVGDPESEFYWKPCNCAVAGVHEHGCLAVGDYFDDAEDPRRLSFNPTFDYSRHADGTFSDPRVQNLYRNLQIANQLHSCCFTCFKYCLMTKVCRFGYPRDYKELVEMFKGDPTLLPYGSIRIDGSGRKRTFAIQRMQLKETKTNRCVVSFTNGILLTCYFLIND